MECDLKYIQRGNALGERSGNEIKVVPDSMRAALDLEVEYNKNSLFLHYCNWDEKKSQF